MVSMSQVVSIFSGSAGLVGQCVPLVMVIMYSYTVDQQAPKHMGLVYTRSLLVSMSPCTDDQHGNLHWRLGCLLIVVYNVSP